jgi:hypothetical protein
MKNFEYQILRFIPDRVSEEFVNVGIVFYSKSDKYLRGGFQKRIIRTSNFFPFLEVRHIQSTLKSLDNSIKDIGLRLWSELEFHLPASINEITSSLLVKDDTSLVFSDTKTGMDLSLEEAFADLYDRLILIYEPAFSDAEIQDDDDVWNKLFKKSFEQKRIISNLKPHTVKTNDEEYKFEYTWKNENLHCYEPVMFNLQKDESIQRKVERWLGRLVNLSKSEEPVDIYLLSKLPEKVSLKEYILKKLQDRTIENATIKIVSDKNADEFAEEVKEEMELHEQHS